MRNSHCVHDAKELAALSATQMNLVPLLPTCVDFPWLFVQSFAFSPWLGSFLQCSELSLDPSWAPWTHRRPILGLLGPILAPPGLVLKPSWAFLDASWDHLGSPWGSPGPPCGLFARILRHHLDILAFLGPILGPF